MRTLTKKIRIRKTEDKLNLDRFMNYFGRFSKKEQSKIAEQINEATFRERWMELDKQLPNLNMSDEEIMNEVRAVRHVRKESKNRS